MKYDGMCMYVCVCKDLAAGGTSTYAYHICDGTTTSP